MKTLVIIGILMAGYLGLKAQSLQKDKAATCFYIVNIDKTLLGIIKDTQSGDSVQTLPECKACHKFIAGLADTFYRITSERFRDELGLDLYPLNELKGKIKFNNIYPDYPDMSNIKRVLKSASGYNFYVDYFVNVFADLPADSTTVPPPSQIKPLYAVSLIIYNASGKMIKKINLSYKSEKTLTEDLKTVSLEQQIRNQLCNVYAEAVSNLTLIYKKRVNVVAQL